MPNTITITRPKSVIGFPETVNEVSARLVAAGVVTMVAATLVLELRWFVPIIALGFLARVLTGPTLSPLGQLVTRVITPRLGLAERIVPGPPKRFAQGIGVAFSFTATAFVIAGLWGAAQITLLLLASAALLEAALGLCLGCKAFALLMRTGLIPEDTCEACNNIWAARP